MEKIKVLLQESLYGEEKMKIEEHEITIRELNEELRTD